MRWESSNLRRDVVISVGCHDNRRFLTFPDQEELVRNI
jgi:hypothetical protein